MGGASSCGRLWCYSCRIVCCVVLVVCLCVWPVSLLLFLMLPFSVFIFRPSTEPSCWLWRVNQRLPMGSTRILSSISDLICFIYVPLFRPSTEPTCPLLPDHRKSFATWQSSSPCGVLFLLCVCVTCFSSYSESHPLFLMLHFSIFSPFRPSTEPICRLPPVHRKSFATWQSSSRSSTSWCLRCDHACAQTKRYIYLYIYIYIYIYMCVCVCVNIYIYIHIWRGWASSDQATRNLKHER